MSRRLIIEFIKQRTKEIAEGYSCLSDIYINNCTKLEFLCSCGHKFKMIWNSFQRGCRCSKCSKKYRPTIAEVKQKTEELADGYVCVSNIYANANSYLIFKCPKNHEFKMWWNSFRRGQRCPTCAGNKKLTIEYVKQRTVEIAKGYSCLSDVYVNSCTKLEFKCNKNHIFKMIWSSFKYGQRCPICYRENNKEKNHPLWKGGVSEKYNNIPLFDTYAHQIDFCEDVQRDPDNYDRLQVRCATSDCRKWFNLTSRQVWERLRSINKKGKDINKFYCSQHCKDNCSVFRQKKYPKGFKDYSQVRISQKEWAKLVKERDNFECQRCGNKKKLVAHHIEGLNENPIESADIDIGITLCKKCHKKAHKEIGCRFVDMRKENICNELH